MFDSIGDAVSSAADTVSDGVRKAVDVGRDLKEKVEQAPAAIARGASDALKGASELRDKVVKGAGDVISSGAKLARRGAELIGKGASVAGRWAWEHKGEIGFWAGTTALMLAIPVSGGASGALAGGLMAARGAAVAAKVAQMGRVGLTAVKVAKAGATAVQGAKAAIGASRVGTALAHGGSAIRAGRVALGGTKVGRAMIAAQKPVNTIAMAAGGANFVDTANKYRQGKASGKDMALATLGVAPIGFLGFKSLAARRAAKVNEKAATVAAQRLDDVAASAAGAKEEVAHVANVAPVANAPRTANVAAEARERAVGTVAKANELRHRAAVTRTAGVDADEAISAQTLARELDDVAARASTAKARAAEAEELAPESLTPAASAARVRLERAEQVAARARREVGGLATKQARAEKVEDAAETVQTALGTTAMHANLVNNTMKASNEGRNSGWSLTDTTIVRTLASIGLTRNARPVTAGAR